MNPYLSVVNQKILFCDILLDQGASKKDYLEENNSHQFEIVLCQSALYQIECAYLNYLREIAATYQYKLVESIFSVQDLDAGLRGINKEPSEIQEIKSLTESRSSWLFQLLVAFKQLSLPPSLEVGKSHTESSSLLEVKQLDDDIYLSYQLLAAWRQDFVEMIKRHRELMHEC
ncbi:MAG: hypothetical protein HN492_05520 [Porticoccus sp.]|jgi:hypothetical protein|nr:hypothetical protein [Porticoccus sp.]